VTMNKYAFHIYVIPEDDRNRQIADGFVLHHQVNDARIQVLPPAGGWPKVLKTFRDEYIPKLVGSKLAHVVMLIDFDDQIEKRRADFEQVIPEEFKARVFVVGLKHDPETLKKGLNIGYEGIGEILADDCATGDAEHWNHEQLQHNDADRQRLVQTVKPFLF
jgi:hypothetical protein